MQTIKLLLSEGDDIGEIMEANAKNCKGLTAMDVFDIVVENSDDVRLREILRCAGALGSQHITAPKQLEPKKNWFEYFKFVPDRDSPSDARNALLVVAALIATVTFQAGVNPPTALTSNAADQSNNVAPPPAPTVGPEVFTGGLAVAAILGSHAPTYLFLFANTLGLAASISIIIYLTGGFPFQRELLISTYSMMFAYGFSVGSIKKTKGSSTIILGIAFLLPFALRWVPRWANFAYKWCTRGANHNLPVSRTTTPPEHPVGNVIHN